MCKNEHIYYPRNNYVEIAKEVGELVTEKQKRYGNSFAKAGEYLRLLYPDGVKSDQYGDMLALVRDFDKSMRIANGDQGEESGWRDKCGYSLLAIAQDKKHIDRDEILKFIEGKQ